MAELQERVQTVPPSGTAPDAPTGAGSQADITLAVEGMSCASCALRIEKGLKKVPGVANASVNLATERATVHYDPTRASVDDLLAKVKATGYAATPLSERSASAPPAPVKTAPARPQTTDLLISGMTCASCVRRVERALGRTQGVTEANVNLATEHAQVTYDPTSASLDDLIRSVERAGYSASVPAPAIVPGLAEAEAGTEEAAPDAETLRRQRDLRRTRRTLALGIVLSVPVVILSMFLWTASQERISCCWCLRRLSGATWAGASTAPPSGCCVTRAPTWTC